MIQYCLELVRANTSAWSPISLEIDGKIVLGNTAEWTIWKQISCDNKSKTESITCIVNNEFTPGWRAEGIVDKNNKNNWWTKKLRCQDRKQDKMETCWSVKLSRKDNNQRVARKKRTIRSKRDGWKMACSGDSWTQKKTKKFELMRIPNQEGHENWPIGREIWYNSINI